MTIAQLQQRLDDCVDHGKGLGVRPTWLTDTSDGSVYSITVKPLRRMIAKASA